MTNPWLLVPASDYERHMASPEVAQLQLLDQLLGDDLRRFAPCSLAVVGCATGTGFRHIDPAVTTRVHGIDLNDEYLSILRDRYGARLKHLELTCGDFLEVEAQGGFDLVHAALVFEYLPVASALDRVSSMLTSGGVLSAVLQLPSAQSAPISNTGVESVHFLGPILRLVDPEDFAACAAERKLELIDRQTLPLKMGKAFEALHFRRR